VTGEWDVILTGFGLHVDEVRWRKADEP
jgi:hypothetical protein